jgi:hypothetical protein
MSPARLVRCPHFGEDGRSTDRKTRSSRGRRPIDKRNPCRGVLTRHGLCFLVKREPVLSRADTSSADSPERYQFDRRLDVCGPFAVGLTVVVDIPRRRMDVLTLHPAGDRRRGFFCPR